MPGTESLPESFVTFQAHPNTKLNEAFAHRPYQGAEPEAAAFLFIGLDANYDAQIENSPIFPALLEYHGDGIRFWQERGVHHPFLLDGYTGDGRFYHRSFARIGFQPKHAPLVSFIELLHVPTVGRNQLTSTDLSREHLNRLNDAILRGSAKYIFIPSAVARLMRETALFDWLPARPASGQTGLGVLVQRGAKTVFSHLHFSVYGKFQARKDVEAAEIRALLPR